MSEPCNECAQDLIPAALAEIAALTASRDRAIADLVKETRERQADNDQDAAEIAQLEKERDRLAAELAEARTGLLASVEIVAALKERTSPALALEAAVLAEGQARVAHQSSVSWHPDVYEAWQATVRQVHEAIAACRAARGGQ